MVAGILRLSDKYGVPTLRKRALRHLDVVYPTSLCRYNFSPSPRFESPNVADHLNAIKLSRDLDIPWIRPVAVYRYVSQPLRAVLTTLHNSDLSGEDLDLCIRGIRELKTLQFLGGAPIRGIAERCSTPASCADAHAKILNGIFLDGGAAPLEVGDSYLNGLCDECCGEVKVHHSTRDVWDQLPSSFDIAKTWSELETLRGNALYGTD
ncbi:hypothetical protein FPV67DRAFT_1132506 [Lyophyllum atratum]|nr:hypothetical protein FPV67DRAFT_1132506 [Lyophyllum atratum]